MYPTTVEVVLAFQDRFTKCDPPVSVITAGELEALLVIVTVPVAPPVVAGVKATVIGTD